MIRRHLAAQNAEEGRFAGAIGTHNAEPVAIMQAHRYIREYSARAERFLKQLACQQNRHMVRPISPRRRAFAAPPDERTAGSTRHGNSLATGVPGWLNYYLPRSTSGHVKLDAIPRAGEDRSVMNFTLPGTSTQWRNGAGVSLAGRSLRWKHQQSCARRADIGPPHQK